MAYADNAKKAAVPQLPLRPVLSHIMRMRSHTACVAMIYGSIFFGRAGGVGGHRGQKCVNTLSLGCVWLRTMNIMLNQRVNVLSKAVLESSRT